MRTRRLNESVEIEVLDRGPGLDNTLETRIFDPFVTSKSNGIGMGLAICRRIVEAHGGQIRAQNRPGGGAEFTFTLPLESSVG